ncbi:AhlS family quorum-quenching N-acyl homoserine lactonase [Halobacillus faecis]
MNNTKLYVLDTGSLKMDKNFMVASHNPATIDNPNPPAEFIEAPVYAVLIDHPEGMILFDTGCNDEADGENGRWPEGIQKLFPIIRDESCYLINRLEQLRVRPQDIKYVVASHLHLDHAGCLELFTDATVIVHDTELSNTMKQYAMTKESGAYNLADIDAWIKNDLQWKTIKSHEDELELAEGIKILNFGSGHAWGMLGLHIELPGEGGIILASDAVYSEENYGPPAKLPGIIYDSVGYMEAVEKIKKYAEKTNSQVWFGHDSKQFRSFVKSTEGFYE